VRWWRERGGEAEKESSGKRKGGRKGNGEVSGADIESGGGREERRKGVGKNGSDLVRWRRAHRTLWKTVA
jgi:hypothetical protein